MLTQINQTTVASNFQNSIGSKIVQMNVLDTYELLTQTNTLTHESFRELKKMFRDQMADAYIVYNPDNDLPYDLDYYNVYIYKDMYNWLHEQYAKLFVECNANKDAAITQLTNKFIDVIGMMLGVRMRYSGALFSLKHMIYGYIYSRNHHFINIPENDNFEFMYEIVCHA